LKIHQLFSSSLLCRIRRMLTLFTAVLELELIQTQMTQKPVLWAEVAMRVRCANKRSVE